MPELSRYQERRQAGLCTTCGSEPADPDNVRCAVCRKKASKAERAKRDERVARGRCRTCGERAPEKGRRDCRPCLDRYARYMHDRS